MGVDIDVGVEKLAVLGRVVVTLTLDMEAPFPHITRISLTFTEKPQVWFSVRILKVSHLNMIIKKVMSYHSQTAYS